MAVNSCNQSKTSTVMRKKARQPYDTTRELKSSTQPPILNRITVHKGCSLTVIIADTLGTATKTSLCV